MLLVACSQDDFKDDEYSSEDKEYVYTMHFDDNVPCYSEDNTRATTNWTSGSSIYLWFKKGSSYIFGTATYNSGKWVLRADSKLSVTSSSTECKAVYVSNPKSTTSSAIELSSSSILYYALGSYTCSSTDIYLTAKLTPKPWRLRFKGTAGKKITLPASENNVKYYSKIPLTSSFSTETSQEDISLTVNADGYTDYIYGLFAYSSGSNNLYIRNESEGNNYKKTISGSKLREGESGYLTIPTSTNYSTYGWEKAAYVNQGATVEPNELYVFTDGLCTNWKFGNSTYSFRYSVLDANSSYLNTDDRIVEYLNFYEYSYPIEEYGTHIFRFSELSSNKYYYLCAVAFDKEGNRGPVFKKIITTRKTTEPIAEITELSDYGSNSWWQFNVSLKNQAEKYYWDYFFNLKHAHFNAWFTLRNINNGGIKSTHSETNNVIYLSTDTISVITVAVDGSGNLGNYSYVSKIRLTPSAARAIGNNSSARRSEACSIDALRSNCLEDKSDKIKYYFKKEE